MVDSTESPFTAKALVQGRGEHPRGEVSAVSLGGLGATQPVLSGREDESRHQKQTQGAGGPELETWHQNKVLAPWKDVSPTRSEPLDCVRGAQGGFPRLCGASMRFSSEKDIW
jgi:hypothetical protein